MDSVENRALELMKKWRLPGGDTATALTCAIDEAKEFIRRFGEFSEKVSEIRGKTEALQKELSGQNEADLRARVSTEALEAYEKGNEEEIGRRRKFCSDALRSMNERAHDAEMELVRLENKTENPARVAFLLEEAQKKYDAEKLKHEAIMLAFESLSEAGDNIRTSLSPLLRSEAEKYMASITEGKYESIGLDSDYSMTADTRGVDLLSAGTKDSAYISLRLSLLGVIFRNEKPFLAIDEALAQLDDKRATAALRLFASYCENGGQCILFTCHSREEKLLDGIIDAEVIKL